MPPVPFPLTSFPGERSHESAGRLVNCYAEALGEGARGRAKYVRSAGARVFAETELETFRGMIEAGGVAFAAFEDEVVTIAANGAVTALDTLPGSQKVIMARNNKAPVPDVVILAGTDAYLADLTEVIAYPDIDVGAPNSVCFLDGYFFFTYGNGLCRSSAINDTAIDLNDFVTAESNPDGLVRGIPFRGQLLLFGQDSCEFWSGAVVNETGFPFNRVTTTPYGLAGTFAIAGHESGFGTHLLWVSKDNGVVMLSNSYHPEKVSTPDLDRLIQRVGNKQTLEASVYTARGKQFFVLSSPDWTWEFCITTQQWNERESYLKTRWRGTQTQYCFGKWLCGDTESGNILVIDADERTESGNPLRVRLESGPVHAFPNRTRIARIDVDVAVGVGEAPGIAPIQTDPTIELSVARDLVHFDNPRLLRLGRQAIADQRVMATRFGLSGPQGFRVRLDIADPVHVGIMGADVSAEVRVK